MHFRNESFKLFTGGNNESGEYVIVFPERIYTYGVGTEEFSHFHKRSVPDKWHKQVDYSIKFSKKDIKFKLLRNDDIVTPGIVVQHFRGNNTWLDEQGSQNGLSCFYEGRVHGNQNSRVLVNLCDGMVSVFYGFILSTMYYW